MPTKRPLIVINKQTDRNRQNDILAVVSEMPGCYLATRLDDACVYLEPSYYFVVKKEDANKLLGVHIVHDEDIPDRTIKCEVRTSGKLDDNDMNVECSKCGRRYCDCESKY